MLKKKMKVTVKLEIEYENPSNLRECLADVRRELKDGLGRGSSTSGYSWLLTTGSIVAANK